MLLWLDLETTGLDPKNDRILQVAYAISSPTANLMTPVTSEIVTINKDAWDLIEANPFVQDMHHATGLLDKLVQPGTKMIEDIEDQILKDIEEVAEAVQGLYNSKVPFTIAGASVHFDKAFIENWMPRLHERLSHRVFDTSTLQAFFGALEIEHSVKNPHQHDAVYDLLYCIEVVEYYRSYMKGV